MNVIKESTGDKEIATYKYPNSVEQLMNFLSEKGYDFKENDFLLTNENYGVDADGYPYIKHLIMLMPVCLEINMTVYHHTKWDFYLDDVADFRNNID